MSVRLLIGGAAIVAAAVLSVIGLRMHDPPLGPDEAIAVIPMVDGIAEGTPVWGVPGPSPIGHVERVRRRDTDLVLRLRFRDSTITRRRGDALRIFSSGLRHGRQLAFAPAPTYEKPGHVSDTLFIQRAGGGRPATVEELLSGLYRRQPTLDSPPR